MTTIRDHYNKLSENQGTVEVPEWGKTIYVGPLTFAQYQRIEAAEKISDSERGFGIIEACAKSQDGGSAFSVEELRDLRLYAPAWLVTVTANKIMAVQNQFKEKEDAQGN